MAFTEFADFGTGPSAGRRTKGREASNFFGVLDSVFGAPPAQTAFSAAANDIAQGPDETEILAPTDDATDTAGNTDTPSAFTPPPPPAPVGAFRNAFADNGFGPDAGISGSDPAADAAPGPNIGLVDDAIDAISNADLGDVAVGVASAINPGLGLAARGVRGLMGLFDGADDGGIGGLGDGIDPSGVAGASSVGVSIAGLEGGLDGVDGGDGGDGGTYICTELHRQGLFPAGLLDAERAAHRTLSLTTYDGYAACAAPYARLMRRSRIATAIARPVAIAWAEQFTGRRPTVSGWCLRTFGEPVVWLFGATLNAIAGGRRPAMQAAPAGCAVSPEKARSSHVAVR